MTRLRPYDCPKSYPADDRTAGMDEEMLEDQKRLVELLESEGWEVTDLELSAYDSPWADEDDPEASVTITARRAYDGTDGDQGDDGGESRFRLK